jgi:hypothetical protein
LSPNFILAGRHLREAHDFGAAFAETILPTIRDANSAKRPALMEAATTELATRLAPIRETMWRLGADRYQIREYFDAAGIGFGDRLVELLTPNPTN